MRIVFKLDYELDPNEDIDDTVKLITEELMGWAGVQNVQSQISVEKCSNCDVSIVRGSVDYSDNQGWVHEASDEAKCYDTEDSPDAFPA